jgi:hypothetical protein
MKQYLLFKLSAIAEYMTEERLQNACMLTLFAVILCADWIVNAICKFLGV